MFHRCRHSHLREATDKDEKMVADGTGSMRWEFECIEIDPLLEPNSYLREIVRLRYYYCRLVRRMWQFGRTEIGRRGDSTGMQHTPAVALPVSVLLESYRNCRHAVRDSLFVPENPRNMGSLGFHWIQRVGLEEQRCWKFLCAQHEDDRYHTF